MDMFSSMEDLVKILINLLILAILYSVKMFSLSSSITVVALFVTNAVTNRKVYLI